ncbi:MAG: hypothetical protein O3A00_08090 [Planctomycetota bacterium]|nr:hypothetical protein [Planctomycetota bacterium]
MSEPNDEIDEFFDDADAEPVKRAKPRRQPREAETSEPDDGFEPTGALTVGLALVYSGVCVGVLGIIAAVCTPYLLLKRPDLFPWLIGSQLIIISSFYLGSLLLSISGRIASLVGVTMESVGVGFYLCILLTVLFDIVGVAFSGTLVASLALKFNLPNAFVKLGDYGAVVTFAGHVFFVIFLWKLTVLVERPKLGILAILALVSWVAFPTTVVLWKNGTLSFFQSAIAVGVSALVALITYGNTLSYLRRELVARR